MAVTGNDYGWVHGIRRNAKRLILGDRDEAVLKTQEFLYRPLVLVAESPTDFMSMLAATPIADGLRRAAVGEALDGFIVRQWHGVTSGAAAAVGSRERSRFVEAIGERLSRDPRITGEAGRAVVDHLSWVARLPGVGREASFLHAYPDERRRDPFASFHARYRPTMLKRVEAPPEIVNHPWLSQFASSEAFATLQRLYGNDHVHYVLADISDEAAFEAVGKYLARERLTLSGFAESNVSDAQHGTDSPRHADRYVVQHAEKIARTCPTDASFTLYRTGGEGIIRRYAALPLPTRATMVRDLTAMLAARDAEGEQAEAKAVAARLLEQERTGSRNRQSAIRTQLPEPPDLSAQSGRTPYSPLQTGPVAVSGTSERTDAPVGALDPKLAEKASRRWGTLGLQLVARLDHALSASAHGATVKLEIGEVGSYIRENRHRLGYALRLRRGVRWSRPSEGADSTSQNARLTTRTIRPRASGLLEAPPVRSVVGVSERRSLVFSSARPQTNRRLMVPDPVGEGSPACDRVDKPPGPPARDRGNLRGSAVGHTSAEAGSDLAISSGTGSSTEPSRSRLDEGSLLSEDVDKSAS